MTCNADKPVYPWMVIISSHSTWFQGKATHHMCIAKTLWSKYNSFFSTKHMSAWINHWKITDFST